MMSRYLRDDIASAIAVRPVFVIYRAGRVARVTMLYRSFIQAVRSTLQYLSFRREVHHRSYFRNIDLLDYYQDKVQCRTQAKLCIYVLIGKKNFTIRSCGELPARTERDLREPVRELPDYFLEHPREYVCVSACAEGKLSAEYRGKNSTG